MNAFRKKEAEIIAALIAAGSQGLNKNSLKIYSGTLKSMKRRKIVLQDNYTLRIHPNVNDSIAKEAQKEANRIEYLAIKKRIDEADFLVNVTRKCEGSLRVTLLTDTGRLYKGIGPNILVAAKEAFEAKDKHEALKEELNLWRNF